MSSITKMIYQGIGYVQYLLGRQPVQNQNNNSANAVFASDCRAYKDRLVKDYGAECANIPVAEFTNEEMDLIRADAEESGDYSVQEKVKNLYANKFAKMATSFAIVPVYSVNPRNGDRIQDPKFVPALYGRVKDQSGSIYPMEAIVYENASYSPVCAVYYQNFIRYLNKVSEQYLIDLYKGTPRGYLQGVFTEAPIRSLTVEGNARTREGRASIFLV